LLTFLNKRIRKFDHSSKKLEKINDVIFLTNIFLPLFYKEIGTSQLDMVEMKDSNKNEMIKKQKSNKVFF